MFQKKRTKLEPSGRKGIFVGYSETSKPYRIFILGQKNIELSRDVIFEEDLAFKRAQVLKNPLLYLVLKQTLKLSLRGRTLNKLKMKLKA